MVSSIPYRSFKEIDLRHSYGTLVVVVLGLVVIIQEPSVTLFACGVVYTLHGPLEGIWRRASGRRLQEAESGPGESAQVRGPGMTPGRMP
jgi:phosphatidylserine synthase